MTTTLSAHSVQSLAPLILAEKVVAAIKTACKDTEMEHFGSINTWDYTGPSTPLAKAVCRSQLEDVTEQEDDYALFLSRYWAKAHGGETDSTSHFVARDIAPKGIVLRTISRIGFLQALPKILDALKGLNVKLEYSRSWLWDSEVKTETGRPTHRHVMVLNIGFNSGQPVLTAAKADAWLKKTAKEIPATEDERVDACVFQRLDGSKLRDKVSSYGWNQEGFEITCDTTKVAEAVAAQFFADCSTRVSKEGSSVTLWVAFAQTAPEVRNEDTAVPV